MIGYAIGTGGSEPPNTTKIPSEQRKQSCYLYINSFGDYIIIDYGTNPFLYINQPPLAGFITHWHSDHTAGLYSARWFDHKYPIYAPREGNWLIEESKNTTPQSILAFETIKVGQFQVTPLPLNHTIETYGYLIESDGERIAHLLDTKGLPPKTLKFLKERTPDRIVLDATFITMKCCGADWGIDKGPGHNNTDDLIKIATEFPGSEVYLTHLPPYAPPSWVIRKVLPEFRVLSDGMQY